ncbi:hypothetical protein N7495_007029 [Penicillium taxi]|uniref:uncharacterized protein n=1 Tax=Penicillium taxi TaxID=168475 RepID=UPI002545633E|nr:uncharacterized protein N7495_007029 [Penicillium taxi]KAJ5895338.1 hypothetical protein N7495_007029 [Penicillium taxi]
MALTSHQGLRAFALSIIFTTLATIFTAARMYTRAVIVGKVGADDYLILISLLCSWVFFGLIIGETYNGSGVHMTDIPKEIFIRQMKCFYVSIPIYTAGLNCAKVSIILLYRRIFATPKMRLACNILLVILVIYATLMFALCWATCVPVSKWWGNPVPGFCFNKPALWFSNLAINITIDLLLLILPIPPLISLQLPIPQKLSIMALFAVGNDNTNAARWSTIECNVAIICADLPSLRPLLSKLLPRIFPASEFNTATQRNTSVTACSYAYALENLSSSCLSGSDKHRVVDDQPA